jgi:hypothetical protein
MINKRIQARAAKQEADAAERYQRLAASAGSTKPLHEWATLRQANEWCAVVRNQMGLTPMDEIPMPKLFADIRASRHITVDIGKLDQPARARLFAAITAILTK